jgi:ribosomal protection tetracycline resistance protein
VMTGKVTAIAGFDGAAAVRTDAVSAGEIAKVSGLGEIQIGDELGPPAASIDDSFFAPPTLESVVVPSDPVDKAALYSALTQLAEQDPLINVRRDDLRQEISVSLYGEVQKEVIEATLSEEFGLTVAFRETTPICIERLRGAGAAAEVLGAQTNPFLATVGLRVEPRPPGSGVCFLADVGIGSVPLYVYKRFEDFAASIEDAVRDTLHRGVYGWEVTDCTVTLTDSGYASPSTTAGDFRKLTPLVLADAIKQIGTVVCEPIHRFRLDGPSDSLQPTLRALAHLGTAPQASAMSDSTFTVEGEIAAARMHLLQQRLGAVTHGEGAVEFVFDRYEPVTGLPPARPRLGDNPFNREEYLLRVAGRVPRAKEPRSG